MYANLFESIMAFLHSKYKVSKNLTFETDGTYKPKISSFHGYLSEKKGFNKPTEFITILDSLNKNDILESMEYYIDQSKTRRHTNKEVKSKSAVLNYNSVIKEYFKFMSSHEIINNPDLISTFDLWENDVRKLDTHLEQLVNKYHLKKKESKPPIKPNDFYQLRYLCDEVIDNYSYTTGEDGEHYKMFLSALILKFLLAYGLKYNMIRKIQIDSLYEENSILNLNGIRLPIPPKLREQIEKYLDIRKSLDISRRDFFIDPFNNFDVYKNTYIIDLIYQYKKNYKIKRKINTTGISKFTVIDMLLKGFPENIISRYTGLGETIMQDCIDRLEGEGFNYFEDIDFINNYMSIEYKRLETFKSL